MLSKIVKDVRFDQIMQENIINVLSYLLELEQPFGVLCKLNNLEFQPELPSYIRSEFREVTLFYLAAYTLESAIIDNDRLIFEAGFGKENFGSLVSVPLFSILQIIVDDVPILVNLSDIKRAQGIKKKQESGGVENSMASFLSNPENSKFFKK